jgi:glycogen synthase
MRIALFTNEYPPHVYGGAGVHVEYLARELAAAEGGAHDVDVLCFGEQREDAGPRGNLRVRGIPPGPPVAAQDPRHGRLLDAVARDLAMAGAAESPDVVHCHTWYAHLAGCVARPLTGARLVLTTHSLEPHRPWKVEQLGTAYHATAWVERTAYQNADGVVAVSEAMKGDVESLYGVAPSRVRVIHNGIDPDEYRPRPDPGTLRRLGVDPEVPFVLFVGRITRQKGILHLVRALRHLHAGPAGLQVVLCAGAPRHARDRRRDGGARRRRAARRAARVVWIPEMLAKPDVIALYTHAACSCARRCTSRSGSSTSRRWRARRPSSRRPSGGIPEIVVPGETGCSCRSPPRAAGRRAARRRRVPAGARRRRQRAARRPGPARGHGARVAARVLAHFSWRAIAGRHARLLPRPARRAGGA